jgi:hypothetical protein
MSRTSLIFITSSAIAAWREEDIGHSAMTNCSTRTFGAGTSLPKATNTDSDKIKATI